MKNPNFIENIVNNLPISLLVGISLLLFSRFLNSESFLSLILVTSVEVSGVYIIVVALYRKNKKMKETRNK